MQNAPDMTGKRIMCVYLAAVAAILLMGVAVITEKRGSVQDYGLGEYVDIGGEWTDESGNPADMGRLAARDVREPVRLYYTLPELTEDTSLVYRSQDAYTRVFAQGELLYETDALEKSGNPVRPENRWNIVTLDDSRSGQTLELQMIPVYSGLRMHIDHVFRGDKAAIIIGCIRNKLPAIVVSIAMCVIGALLMGMDLTVNYRKVKDEKDHSLLHLGRFTLILGCWSLIETNMLQFFVRSSQTLMVLDCMLLVLAVIPMFLFIDGTLPVMKNRLVRVLCVADLAFLGMCIVLPMVTKINWYELLILAGIYMLIAAVVFAVRVIKGNMAFLRAGRGGVRIHLQLAGMGVLAVAAFLEAVRYIAADGMDRAYILRIGIVIFIFCFGVSSQLSLLKLIIQGMQYDNVHKLAYSDKMTNLGNRTAFMEHLEECAGKKTPCLGIVFLDINNLKAVNDVQGHGIGDRMIRVAADVIGESFGVYGKVYRVGGDEFCVLIDQGRVREKYEQAMAEFQHNLGIVNGKEENGFVLQIAQGFAWCAAESMEAVNDALKEADARMYQHKAELKAAR